MRLTTRSFGTWSTFLVVLLAAPVLVSAASPALSLILPRGIQRGTEAQLDFRGARLADAQEILFYEPGLEVVKIEPNGDNRLTVTVKVAADCRLGEHTAQVRTASGLSDFRTFYVGALPSVAEAEPNSEFEAPQAISLNVTVDGVVQNEDVDYYVVEAKKGQRIAAEVEAMRLGTYLFDPYVAILDAKRFELAASDDSPLAKQDAFATVVAPEDGKYYVEIRESAYGGNGNCRYRLHVGSFPRPTAVYPAGAERGTTTEVTFLGDAAGAAKKSVALPANGPADFGLFAEDDGGIAPSANSFRLFDHGNVLEVEPNDAVAQATSAELPLALNGIIEKDGDVDFFKFAAKKGQVFEVECYARRVGSPLDPVMVVHRADGRGIASNDDSRGPDSYFRFSVPADGEYLISVRDHLKKGGSDFVYRVEFQPVEPQLTLGIPRVARYSQYRQWVVVPRGNRFATLLSASRRNFGGELVLEGKDLPAGVTMHAEPMPSNMNVMPVIFEAAADAPVAGKLVDFTARLNDPEKQIVGHYENSADLIRGSPGQSIYWSKQVDKLAFAVVEEVPFTLEIIEPKVPIVQNGSLNLKVVAHRQEGFDAAITLQFPFRPPGIGTRSTVVIPAGKSEALYPLNAAANAQTKDWTVYVIGSADVGGQVWVSSQPAKLSIAAPYVKVALDRAAVEQGQQTEIYCKIEQAQPFDGEATIRLVGLPNKVTTSELKLTKETEEIAFKVATEKDSPPGRHKNIICQVVITAEGEPILHRVAGVGELRIDKPLPPKVAQPEKPKPQTVAKKEEPKEAPKKRLSRLEQLRLQAKQRLEAADGGGSE